MLQGSGVNAGRSIPPLLLQARVDPSGILTWPLYKLIPKGWGDHINETQHREPGLEAGPGELKFFLERL